MGSNRAFVFIALHSRNALPARRDRNGWRRGRNVARVGHALPANEHLVYLPAISRTTRKRALPLIIRSYASAAFSNGKISFIECTSADALNSSVSCESM